MKQINESQIPFRRDFGDGSGVLFQIFILLRSVIAGFAQLVTRWREEEREFWGDAAERIEKGIVALRELAECGVAFEGFYKAIADENDSWVQRGRFFDEPVQAGGFFKPGGSGRAGDGITAPPEIAAGNRTVGELPEQAGVNVSGEPRLLDESATNENDAIFRRCKLDGRLRRKVGRLSACKYPGFPHERTAVANDSVSRIGSKRKIALHGRMILRWRKMPS